MDVRDFNRKAWDIKVEQGSEWTKPVSSEVIAAARAGEWSIFLTATRPVPQAWLPASLPGVDVLCLASGGGQQGPVLAAAGANVTVVDQSPRQLAQDRLVAQREGLRLSTVAADMADLSAFSDGSFDLIIHPVSNLFVPSISEVWREAFRVLRPGGALLAGFMNPDFYLFDAELEEQGILQVKHSIPYSDLADLSEAERARINGAEAPLEFSHTLEAQIGGQLKAGFCLTGFYEDRLPGRLVSDYFPALFATRAVKPTG